MQGWNKQNKQRGAQSIGGHVTLSFPPTILTDPGLLDSKPKYADNTWFARKINTVEHTLNIVLRFNDYDVVKQNLLNNVPKCERRCNPTVAKRYWKAMRIRFNRLCLAQLMGNPRQMLIANRNEMILKLQLSYGLKNN